MVPLRLAMRGLTMLREFFASLRQKSPGDHVTSVPATWTCDVNPPEQRRGAGAADSEWSMMVRNGGTPFRKPSTRVGKGHGPR